MTWIVRCGRNIRERETVAFDSAEGCNVMYEEVRLEYKGLVTRGDSSEVGNWVPKIIEII